METIHQIKTPLNTLYFSDYNINLLQRAIRQQYKTKYGFAIDYQNSGDLFTIMRVVFINNAEDHFTKTCDQVRSMNEKVIKTAIGQINTGVSQYMGYLRDSQAPLLPLAQPINTSTYGKKVGLFQPSV